MTVRQQLYDLLSQSFPQPGIAGATVLLLHPTQVDPPAAPTIMLDLAKVAPGAARGIRDYTYNVLCLAPPTDSDLGNAVLENLLEQVLVAIDTYAPGLALTWAEATRGTYRGTTPVFTIPVTATVAVTI